MKLLVVVNFQNDFISGSLGFPRALELEPKLKELIPTFEHVIYILNEHDDSYKNQIEGLMIDTPHCIKNTIGARMPESIEKLIKDSDLIFKTNTNSSIDFMNYLKDHAEFDDVFIAGLYSHMDVFVNATLIRVALPSSRVTVLKDYTDSFDKALEAKAYNVLNSIFVEVK